MTINGKATINNQLGDPWKINIDGTMPAIGAVLNNALVRAAPRPRIA